MILVGTRRFTHCTHVWTFQKCASEQLDSVDFDWNRLFDVMKEVAEPHRMSLKPHLTHECGTHKVRVWKPTNNDMENRHIPDGLWVVSLVRQAADGKSWEDVEGFERFFVHCGIHFKTVDKFAQFWCEWEEHLEGGQCDMRSVAFVLDGIRIPAKLGTHNPLGTVTRCLSRMTAPDFPREEEEEEEKAQAEPAEEAKEEEKEEDNPPVARSNAGGSGGFWSFLRWWLVAQWSDF